MVLKLFPDWDNSIEVQFSVQGDVDEPSIVDATYTHNDEWADDWAIDRLYDLYGAELSQAAYENAIERAEDAYEGDR